MYLRATLLSLSTPLSFCFSGPGFRTLLHPPQKPECLFAPIKISLAQLLCSYLFTMYLSGRCLPVPSIHAVINPTMHTKVLEDPTSTNLPLNSVSFSHATQIRADIIIQLSRCACKAPLNNEFLFTGRSELDQSYCNGPLVQCFADRALNRR